MNKGGITGFVEKGMIKPEGVYAHGIALGNRELAKKHGIDISRVRGGWEKGQVDASAGAGAVMGRDGRGKVLVAHRPHLVAGMPNGKISGLDKGLATRHEIFEIMALKNNYKPGGVQRAEDARGKAKAFYDNYEAGLSDADRVAQAGKTAQMRADTDKGLSSIDMQPAAKFHSHEWGGTVGVHANPEVLTRESSLVATTPHAARLREMRKKTGEANFVKKVSGHEYGSRPLPGKAHSKARNFGHDALEQDYFGIPQSVYHVD